ncbi:ABC transporter ATP-binding protein, partial [Rhizobiales bacterium L72]|nr:ABC transporter ATP-binding protein [Propylenella binzhouense]
GPQPGAQPAAPPPGQGLPGQLNFGAPSAPAPAPAPQAPAQPQSPIDLSKPPSFN